MAQCDTHCLDSEPRSAPRLIIVVDSNNQIHDGYIVADTIQLHVTSPPSSDVPAGMCSMVVNLLACYFAWDLSYPKAYQVLVFLHRHLFVDSKETMFRSVALMKLDKQLKNC